MSAPEFERIDTDPRLQLQPLGLERFGKSQDPLEEQRLLAKLSSEVEVIDGVGFVVGRFQPVHAGHKYLWRAASLVAENLVIAIGSANRMDHDNPFTAAQTEYMVADGLREIGLMGRVTKVIHINDHDEDLHWLEEAKAKAGRIDVVVGNNDWVNGIFENAGIRVQPIPMLQRSRFEGRTIRAQLRSEGHLN